VCDVSSFSCSEYLLNPVGDINARQSLGLNIDEVSSMTKLR